jgi:O-antigen ligase
MGRVSRPLALSLAAAIVVTLGVALAFGYQPLVERFAVAAQDLRFAAAPVIFENANSFLPFGSGVGSFPVIFQSFEPVSLIGEQFLNHAHNDYLEIWLEAGILGLAGMVAFLLWWGRATWRAWTTPGLYGDLARLGALVTGLLLLHSVVDYPLRTPALATLFAFAIGLLATPESASARHGKAVAHAPAA